MWSFGILVLACTAGFTAASTTCNETTLEARAERILADTPLIDGHNDLAYFLRWAHSNHIYWDNFTIPFESGNLDGQVDLVRLREGRVGGTFWSIYWDCPKGGNFTPEYFRDAIETSNAAVDVILRLQDKYPDTFGRPQNSSDALEIFHSGKIISPLGLEGLHLIGNSFTKLREYHSRGVRYATLTHNCHNMYADSAMSDLADGSTVPSTPKWHGVSPLGEKLVLEMNRLGMLVDLSHTSADTMRGVLGAHAHWNGSLAPPIFSHSSAFALCPHPRNVPDDVLHLVGARGGVVMVTFWQGFVSCYWPEGPVEGGLPVLYEPNVTISQIVRHVRHIGELIGYDHVGLGSDFDGVPWTLEGLNDISHFPNLVVEMLRQGTRDSDVGKVVGGNLLRLWGEVDEVAARLQAEGALPAEDDLVWLPDPWEGF